MNALLALILTTFCGIATAKVPTALEAQFAEAVLSFQAQNYAEASKLLDSLHQAAPGVLEILELKALNEKLSNRPKDAEKTYLDIIRTKKKEKASNQELAPYFFEIGSLKFQAKDFAQAKKYFNFAKKYEFNLSATHFYMGMVGLKLDDLELARESFAEVISSSALELKPPTHLYLAQIASKSKNSARAVDHLLDAYSAADKIVADETFPTEVRSMATQVKTTALETLKPMDRSNFFGSASLSFSYDSNVLSYPDSTPDTQAEGKRSVKALIQSGIGYASSPIRFLQFVPSYRNSYNYNFNSDSKSAEYFSNTLSLYINRNPLSSAAYGMKLDGSYVFKNDYDLNAEQSTYRPYQFSGLGGPYFKRQFTPALSGLIEGSLGPQTYYLDPESSVENRRTGFQWNGKVSLQRDTSHRYFNPGVSLSFQFNDTDGKDVRTQVASAMLNNWSYVTDKIKLSTALLYQLTRYPYTTTGDRNDRLIQASLSSQYKMNRRLSWISDTRVLLNHSNQVSLYSYSKFSVSLGISYSFF